MYVIFCCQEKKLKHFTDVVWFNIQVFWCAAFALHRRVLREITCACGRFLWLGSIVKQAIVLLSWADTCKGYRHGGINLSGAGTKVLVKVTVEGSMCEWFPLG